MNRPIREWDVGKKEEFEREKERSRERERNRERRRRSTDRDDVRNRRSSSASPGMYIKITSHAIGMNLINSILY